MTNTNPESNLLQRLSEDEPRYAAHHHVAYPPDTLKAIALLASTLPYIKGDAYETGIDLLDEAGAEVRVRRAISNKQDVLEVGLRELASVVSRKTGRSLDEFIR